MTNSAVHINWLLRSQLIWIYTACKGAAYLGSAGPELKGGCTVMLLTTHQICKGHVSLRYYQTTHSETIYRRLDMKNISCTTYSRLSLSRHCLSRITAYLEVKIWSLPKQENLTTCKKYCGKEEKLLLRSNFSSFPQYFQYISNFRSPITYIYLLNEVVQFFFCSFLQIWYVEVRLSWSI